MRHAADNQTANREYDANRVRHEVLEICDYYLTERRKEGRRYTYRCPECGGRRFEVEPVRGMAGCFSAECRLPKTTDAIGIISYMESLDTHGAGFVECLKQGYEILGLETHESTPDSSGLGNRHLQSPRPRSWIAGEAEPDPESPDSLTSSEAGYDGGPEESPGFQIEAYTELPDGSVQPLEAFVLDEDTGEIRISGTRYDHGPDVGWVEDPAPVNPAKSEGTQSADVPSTRSQGYSQEETLRAGCEHRPTAIAHRQREINHRVFERLLGMCRLEQRDREFLAGRGLDEATIRGGGFGSMSKKRCRYVTDRLDKRFNDEDLLSVPGFYRAESGQLRFTLYGDYALIPYYDREGYILTVEGRLTGQPTREGDPKYKALANSGVHLYVHPRFDPGEVVAFCEGAIGAMVAARCGIPVAAIKGMRTYRQPPTGRYDDYSVLPELAGVDFAGKEVVYIPDLDVKPKTRQDAFGIVPEACEWLIQRQGGRAKVALLPEGAKDLDEWLLSLEEEERVPEFMKLLRDAAAVRQWDPERYRAVKEDVREDSAWGPAEKTVHEVNTAWPEGHRTGPTRGEQPTSAFHHDPGHDQNETPERAGGTMSEDGEALRPAQQASSHSDQRRSSNPSANESHQRQQAEGQYKKARLLKNLGDRGGRDGGHGGSDRQTAAEQTGDRYSTPIESSPNLPAKIGADKSKQDGGREASKDNLDSNDARPGRRQTNFTAPNETPQDPGQDPQSRSRLAASHPSMAFWYEVEELSDEQLEQRRAEAVRRRRLREQRGRSKSRAVHVPKWNMGEVAIALAVSVIVGAALVAGIYFARTQEGVVGLVGDLLTWPVWWIELVLCWSLGLLAAEWVTRIRHLKRQRQLARHAGASGRKGGRRGR